MTVTSEYVCQVRFSDVDAFGHVNNVSYYEYYQEARVSLLMSLAQDEDDPVLGLVVARMRVDYRRPMLYRFEPYVISSEITQVGELVPRGRVADPRPDRAVLHRRVRTGGVRPGHPVAGPAHRAPAGAADRVTTAPDPGSRCRATRRRR